MRLLDGLVNLATRLGSRADKARAGGYTVDTVAQADLEAAYRTTWLRKIVDIPAEDAVREWRLWQADEAGTKALEAEEKRLGIQGKTEQALKWARLHGGAGMVLGGLPGDPAMPVNPREIGKGELRFVTVLDRYALTAGETVQDPMDPGYGLPAYYTVGASAQRIHPSRVVRFVGNPYPSHRMAADGWGDPIYMGIRDRIVNADTADAAIAHMLSEAKLDVIKIPRLTERLATAEYETMLLRRFTVSNSMKSLVNALLLDAGGTDGQGAEEHTTKQLKFEGLPDVLDRFLMILCAFADIPATRLLGRSPQGMNATGESDLRNYYDMVGSRQRLSIAPALAPLDVALRASAAVKADVWYAWNPLYGTSEQDGALIEKAYADGLVARINTGALDVDVLAKGELSRMIESGRYPGLEAAANEAANEGLAPEPTEEDADEMDRLNRAAEAGNVTRLRVAANDAAPRTLYVRRDVVNRGEIERWARAQGFADIVPDLHVTIAYSRAPVDWFKVGTSWADKVEMAAGGPRQMERLGDDGRHIALLITAPELVWRHEEIVRAGASWDWPEYQPHITVQVGGDVDLANVTPYRGRIVLGPEIFEELRAE